MRMSGAFYYRSIGGDIVTAREFQHRFVDRGQDGGLCGAFSKGRSSESTMAPNMKKRFQRVKRSVQK